VYGYVYQQLALLIAAFMAGMALGAWLGLVGQASWWGRLQPANPSDARTLLPPGFPAHSTTTSSWPRAPFPRPAPLGMTALACTQVLSAAAPLVLLALFQAIARAGTASSLLGSQIAFPALALASGTLGGFEFALASRIFFGGTETGAPLAPRPGTLYALDLMGSCLGAILFSVWLVPVFGFLKTALLSAMVSLAAAALAMLAHPPAGARRTPGR
jgi:predicted membrane-bound spermidine synthase